MINLGMNSSFLILPNRLGLLQIEINTLKVVAYIFFIIECLKRKVTSSLKVRLT